MRVKDDPNAITLLFRIIETSQVVEAAMQAATLLQSVLLQRYPTLSKAEKDGIKSHCMHIVLSRQNSQGTHDVVSGQLLTVVAILYKKGWLTLSENERREGVTVVPQLLSSDATVLSVVLLLPCRVELTECGYSRWRGFIFLEPF